MSMATDLNFTKVRSREAVDYIFNKIANFLSEGDPQTGETIKINASKAPVFKAGTALKELVNK